jgi:hypothetical protein
MWTVDSESGVSPLVCHLPPRQAAAASVRNWRINRDGGSIGIKRDRGLRPLNVTKPELKKGRTHLIVERDDCLGSRVLVGFL